ncbi:MAG: hypothetical protein KJO07_03430, partial [Deltaproteobacteria bacterium]|nr:hypothetical protein [Deltaproteobacteria bacterium]
MNKIALLLAAALAACGSSDSGVGAVIDLPAARSDGHFFDHPFPSDLRLTADGSPDVAGYPNPTGSSLLGDLITVAGDRRGFTTQSTTYVRFDGRIAPIDIDLVIMPGDEAVVRLVDIDPESPARGTQYPV